MNFVSGRENLSNDNWWVFCFVSNDMNYTDMNPSDNTVIIQTQSTRLYIMSIGKHLIKIK